MAIPISTQTHSNINYEDKSDLDKSDLGNSLPYRSASPLLEMIEKCLDEQTALRASMSEGYQTMAAENLRFAEEALPIALETWPQWE